MKIESSINPVEIEDTEVRGLPNDADALLVKAHHIFNRLVILDWRGHSITVSATELEQAIRNARNHEPAPVESPAQPERCPTCNRPRNPEGLWTSECCEDSWHTQPSPERPVPKDEPEKRLMRLPYNSNYPDFKETHPENDWCAKAGCTPAPASFCHVHGRMVQQCEHFGPVYTVPKDAPPLASDKSGADAQIVADEMLQIAGAPDSNWWRSCESAERHWTAIRDKMRFRLQSFADSRVKEALADQAEELRLVLSDWNELVKASGSRTHGGAIGHVSQLRRRAEAAEALLVEIGKIAADIVAHGKDGTKFCIAMGQEIFKLVSSPPSSSKGEQVVKFTE